MSGLQEIPPMSDPLGKYWDQPCRSKILIDDKIALMDRQTFRELMAYDNSTPSGVYVGKMWSRSIYDRNGEAHRLLLWFGESDDPDRCSINFRDVVFL